MTPLVQVDQRFVDFTVFLGKGNGSSYIIVGNLQVAHFTLKFLEVVGDVFGGDEFVAKQRAQKASGQRMLLVSY